MNLGRYSVIYTEQKDAHFDSYICEKGDRTLYRILSVKDIDKEMIPFFCKLKNEDLIESFVHKGGYYVVFRREKGLSLAELDEQEILDAARDIVKTLIVKNMPPELALPTLNKEKIIITPQNTVGFAYVPPVLSVRSGEQDVLKGTALLFRDVLPENIDPQFMEWLNKMENGGFDSLCRAYSKMPVPTKMPPETKQKKASFFEKYGEKLTAAVTAAIAVSAVVAGAWLWLNMPKEQPENGNIESIGTIFLAD